MDHRRVRQYNMPYHQLIKEANFSFCRLLKNELIAIAPASRNVLYIGTEIIWSRLTAFYLPKASPFEVRTILYNCLFL